MTLGLAFGGANLQSVIESGDSAKGLGIGTAIWLVVSTLVALFAGSYASGRVSGMISTRVGRIQGVVISALFFGLLLSQLGAAIGSLGRGVGATVGAVGGATSDLAQNSQVQDIIDNAIGDLNLKSSPEVVIKGVASRLIRGDQQSAVTYLSRQTGVSRGEAQQRLQGLKNDFQTASTNAGITAAKTIKVAGWTLFGALLLGMLAAMFGGGLGVQTNLRTPLSGLDKSALRNQKEA